MSGELAPSGNTKCRVGGTAAVSIKVNCSGVTRPARSKIPFAALVCTVCAAAKSLNTPPMILHISLLGSCCPGSLLISAPKILASSGTSRCSRITCDRSAWGVSIFFIFSISTNFLSAMDIRMTSTSAASAFSHIVRRAAL